MRKFKVAMVQHKVPTSNVRENTELAIRYITEAKAEGADFVLFPECFLSAYQFPKICETLQPVEEIETNDEFAKWCEDALDDDCTYLEKIRRVAKELSIGVEITCLTKGKKYPQNTAFIIDRDGSIILKYL